ncbi:MAG: glycosyltransferase family 2 protein [Rhodocyclaceae bacterium]|nr:glycosyltransferase family 2 protein [Rhodocyclaceae bacterium]MDZ4216500.1 glycosyltransferase family 2 protein [Rhodocyclaceae bacterium]
MNRPSTSNEDSVAVVIVSYRSAPLTIACLASLAAERAAGRPADLKAVVVDNDSGDTGPVAAAIDAHGWSDWVALVRAPKNGGFGYGNNLGAATARATWNVSLIHFLNPDTQVRAGAIVALRDFLAAHPRAALAGSRFLNGDGSAWPYAFRFPGLASEFEGGLSFGPVSRLLHRHVVPCIMSSEPAPIDWVSGASVMMRAAALDELRGFDESFFLYFEETDLCLRARQAGWDTWYVPDSLVVHIAGQSTGVTCRDQAPRRLPAYWYESRRHYFVLNHGRLRTAAIDVAALVAHALGRVKRRLQGRAMENVPHFLGDLWRHSVLRSWTRPESRRWRDGTAAGQA